MEWLPVKARKHCPGLPLQPLPSSVPFQGSCLSLLSDLFFVSAFGCPRLWLLRKFVSRSPLLFLDTKLCPALLWLHGPLDLYKSSYKALGWGKGWARRIWSPFQGLRPWPWLCRVVFGCEVGLRRQSQRMEDFLRVRGPRPQNWRKKDLFSSLFALRNFPFYFFLRKAALPRAKFLWFLKMLHNPRRSQLNVVQSYVGRTQSFLSDVWMRTDTASQLGKPSVVSGTPAQSF